MPAIFEFLERRRKVDRVEMYQVFNMGIGMVAIVAREGFRMAARLLKGRRIGVIEQGKGKTELVW